MASAELPLMMTYLPVGTSAKTASRFHPADLDVVERDVEGVGILDQAVVGDDRHALRDRALDRRLDGRAVLGEDDEDVGALRDQVLEVAGLRLGRRLGVVGDVAAAAGLDRGLATPARPTSPSAPPGSCSRTRRRRSRPTRGAPDPPLRPGRRGGAARGRRVGGLAGVVVIVVAAGGDHQCGAHDERHGSTDVHAVSPPVSAANPSAAHADGSHPPTTRIDHPRADDRALAAGAAVVQSAGAGSAVVPANDRGRRGRSRRRPRSVASSLVAVGRRGRAATPPCRGSWTRPRPPASTTGTPAASSSSSAGAWPRSTATTTDDPSSTSPAAANRPPSTATSSAGGDAALHAAGVRRHRPHGGHRRLPARRRQRRARRPGGPARR